MKINSIKARPLKYLKSYTIGYEGKDGSSHDWELVSRGNLERLENEIIHHKSYTDGTMIFATDESGDYVAMLKEYRVSAGQHIYMCPAGLIDPGEAIEQTAPREFKEETGLELCVKHVEKERYVSVGIVNERVNVVYGIYSGQPTKKFQEPHEDADIIFVDRVEAKRLLKEEEVSIRTAMLLQCYFRIHPYFDRD